jgi:autotransporter-associated beta strand protein
MRSLWAGAAVAAFACVAEAQVQTWIDGTLDKSWSTSAPNWDAGVPWANGGSARFSGGVALFGETVEVGDALSVANITFAANGYVVADADDSGTLAAAGAPSVFDVPTAGHTGTVSEVLGGAGGLTKTGAGALALTARTNVFTGVLRVSAGTLLLSRGALFALGATGAGNETVVEAGATLNFNGAYTNNVATAERLSIAGAGTDGQGALVNTGAGSMNGGFGALTLLGDATIGGPSRIDLRNPVAGSGWTLTKAGACELAVGNAAAVTNCAIVIAQGNYTYMHNLALGGADYDTTLNGGALRSYGSYTVTERIEANGGTLLASGNGTGAPSVFNIAGRVLLNSNLFVSAENNNVALEVTGLLEGPGGITRSANTGRVHILCDTNTYAGMTVIPSGTALYVGKTNAYAGVLGYGTVSNAGTLNAYSPRLCRGSVVNSGTLLLHAGTLGESAVLNSGTLYVLGGDLGGGALTNTSAGNLHFDRGGPFAVTNALTGAGNTRIRYKTGVTLAGNVWTTDYVRVCDGSLTVTNGARLDVALDLNLATRADGAYTNAVMSFPVTAAVNVAEGALVNARDIIFGNGSTISNGLLHGTVNQYGGVVRTYGATAESNGIRVAHYPLGLGTYRMMGGTLLIDNGYDLGIATDGTGWVHQTGGEIYTSRVMLNERTGAVGFGRLTVEGGVLNIGLTNGVLNVVSNGIDADSGAPYLVEYGGAGGVVRAVTNFSSALRATLYGTGADAITFDTQGWRVSLSGNLSGDGGLNVSGAGAGVLTLFGNNTYAGPTRVLSGALARGSAGALPAGGEVLFRVTAADDGGRLHSDGDLSFAGIVVGVANPEELDTADTYTIGTFGSSVSVPVGATSLPKPWYVHYNWGERRVQLKAATGSVLVLR